MGRRTPTRSVNLPDDILTEIFYRLPWKSVFRFKCVSKSWLSRISHPLFIRGYTSLQPTQWTLLEKLFQIDHKAMIKPCHNFLQNIDASRIDPVQPRLSELAAFRWPKSRKQRRSTTMRYEIAAISNGFLLCRLYNDPYARNLRYCIINPITWQYLELPQQNGSKNAPVLFAEGFLTQVDQELGIVKRYLVVIPTDTREKTTRHFVRVFSSETGRWRNYVLESPTPFAMLSFTISFGANERIHWYHDIGRPRHNDLVAYDPFNNCNSCRITQIPELDSGTRDCFTVLDAFEGRLRCIRSTATKYRDSAWEVWTLMSKFEEGVWTLVHRINTESMGSWAPIQPALDEFLPISNPADPNILYFGSKDDVNRLVSYNIKTGKCKLLMNSTTGKFDMDRVRQRKCPLYVLPRWPACFRAPAE